MIASFLSCRYGKSQVDRLVRGSVQTGLNLDDFDKLLIPKVPAELTQRLARAIAVETGMFGDDFDWYFGRGT